MSKSSESPRVSIIIPSWNGLELLKVCLPSILNQSYKDYEILVVDNGSTDGSRVYLQRHYPQVQVINLDKNYGFAKAVNLGIKQSLGRYILLLNNDTKLEKDCLKLLYESADQHPEAGMIASKMLNFHHPDLIDGAGGYIDAVGHANTVGHGQKDGDLYNQSGYVFLVSAGGGLFKRNVFDKIGLFDEDYFAYFEDVDLSFRAQLQGFKVWYQPKAIIYHIHKATSSKNRKFTEYLQFRNMTQTIIKDFPVQLLLHKFNWLKILLVNLNTVRYMMTIGCLTQAIRAEAWIIWNLPKLLSKRHLIQSNIKINPQYIIANIMEKRVTFFGLLKKGI